MADARLDWYLPEWLEYREIDQAELRRRCKWSKRKGSDLASGQQRYNRDALNEAAHALEAAPYEMLLHPLEAMNIRELLAAAENYHLRAAERRDEYRGPPPAGEPAGLSGTTRRTG